MEYENFNQEVQNIFDQSTEPNVFSIDFKFKICLQSLPINTLSQNQSIKMMLNLTNAILFLKSNKLEPCQIKFQWVGCDQNHVWGLQHAICYRTMNISKSLNTYDPSEYNYHEDQENQLMWNLGKIWLRVYTKAKIQIVNQKQPEINSLIEQNVPNVAIREIITKLLTKKKQQRICFEDFIQDDVFNIQQSPKKFYSSLLTHFTSISKFAYLQSKVSVEDKEINTPHTEAKLRRDMKQVLQTVSFLDQVRETIKNMYENNIARVYALFIMSSYQYCLLKHLDQKKSKNQIQDHSIQERKFYSQYANKMLSLKDQVDRKLRMKIFQELTEAQRNYLIPSNKMHLDQMHRAYKQIISTYYQEAIDDLPKEGINTNAEKIALQFIIARICSILFSQQRTAIFGQFMEFTMEKKLSEPRQLPYFQIGAFYDKLRSCQDGVKCRNLRKKIRNQYFKT